MPIATTRGWEVGAGGEALARDAELAIFASVGVGELERGTTRGVGALEDSDDCKADAAETMSRPRLRDDGALRGRRSRR